MSMLQEIRDERNNLIGKILQENKDKLKGVDKNSRTIR